MLAYPARLIPGSDRSVMLVLPDVPELVVVAGTEDEAFERAEPLLDVILKGYEDEGRPLPWPTDVCGAPTVESRRYAGDPGFCGLRRQRSARSRARRLRRPA